LTIATKTPGTNEPGNPLELSKHFNAGAHCWTTDEYITFMAAGKSQAS
jgi:hypothetical protein